MMYVALGHMTAWCAEQVEVDANKQVDTDC